jgi:hypothetical protein
MGWQELRERLVFMVMSAFVVWHVLAIMIAPASDNSALVQSLRRVFDPYHPVQAEQQMGLLCAECHQGPAAALRR